MEEERKVKSNPECLFIDASNRRPITPFQRSKLVYGTFLIAISMVRFFRHYTDIQRAAYWTFSAACVVVFEQDSTRICLNFCMQVNVQPTLPLPYLLS
jgi:hypothetical protein